MNVADEIHNLVQLVHAQIKYPRPPSPALAFNFNGHILSAINKILKEQP
jgi:hypothetical protein